MSIVYKDIRRDWYSYKSSFPSTSGLWLFIFLVSCLCICKCIFYSAAAANLYSFRGTHGACRRQNAQSTSAPQSNVEPACYESNSCWSSKMMRVGQKQFFFDLGSNKSDHFLEITNGSYSREGHLTEENVNKRCSAEMSETQCWTQMKKL